MICFVSPERLKNPEIDNKASDIYSCGMLIYEVLKPSSYAPWDEEVPKLTYEVIKEKVLKGERPDLDKIEVKEGWDAKVFASIIEYSWQEEPDLRPDAAQLLNLISYVNLPNCKKTVMENTEEECMYILYLLISSCRTFFCATNRMTSA